MVLHYILSSVTITHHTPQCFVISIFLNNSKELPSEKSLLQPAKIIPANFYATLGLWLLVVRKDMIIRVLSELEKATFYRGRVGGKALS